MMNRLCYAFILLAVLCFANSCNSNEGKKFNVEENRIDKGILNIEVDAGLEPIIKQQVEVFKAQYDSLQVNVAYKSEAEIFAGFSKKKVSAIILARELSEAEKESLKSNDSIYANQVKIAYDAVALIGNKSFDDGKLSIDYLKALFDPKNLKEDGTKMVFANQSSSTIKYVLNLLGYKDQVSPQVYALGSNNDVVDYVSKSKDAIGFIPFNYLSDVQNAGVQQLLGKIKVLSLRAKNEKGEEVTCSANQSDIATGVYPLKRTVNVVTNFSYNDNPEGLFVNFLYKGKGARIFLRGGLVPVQIPSREINVNTEGLNGLN